MAEIISEKMIAEDLAELIIINIIEIMRKHKKPVKISIGYSNYPSFVGFNRSSMSFDLEAKMPYFKGILLEKGKFERGFTIEAE